MAWALQDAKARFSELLDIVAAEGPQTVTRRGVETAVIVPVEQWKRLTASAPRPLLDILLSPEPKADFDRHIPRRRSRGLRLRPVHLE
jgi:prevent-host-death family protein